MKFLPQVARDVADDLYTLWLDFKRQYRQLLTWAEQSARFDAVLAAHTDVAELALLLDTALDVLGPEQLTAALDDGTFAQLAALPAGAAPLLKATGSPDAVLAWAALTPKQLDAVAELGLAQQFDPHTVDAALVTALLALDEPVAQANLENAKGLGGIGHDRLFRNDSILATASRNNSIGCRKLMRM